MVKRLHHPLRRIMRLPKRGRPGTAPGTIRIDPRAVQPVIRVIAYGPEQIEEATIDRLEAIDEFIGAWPVVWVNVDGLGDEQVLRALGEQFQIHRLALEDVANVHQRAKLEPYEDHLYLVMRMMHIKPHLDHEQLSLFLGSNFVLTFQERAGDGFDAVRERLRQRRGRIRQSGPDYLAYALIDAVIDAYFPVLEEFGDNLESIEARVLERPEASIVAEIHEIKRELLAVRRAVWPLREALSGLMRDEHGLISSETRIYLRDCYDHCVQTMDMVETFRELASAQTDLYLSSVGQRTNEIMKVLTIFAAVFIPLTFVAGIYGMNFDTSSPWNLPELEWRYGYPAVLTVMVVLAGGLLFYFRRKGWIGSGEKRDVGNGEERED